MKFEGWIDDPGMPGFKLAHNVTFFRFTISDSNIPPTTCSMQRIIMLHSLKSTHTDEIFYDIDTPAVVSRGYPCTLNNAIVWLTKTCEATKYRQIKIEEGISSIRPGGAVSFIDADPAKVHQPSIKIVIANINDDTDGRYQLRARIRYLDNELLTDQVPEIPYYNIQQGTVRADVHMYRSSKCKL